MTYLLQVSTCWIVFYGLYMLFMQKETFFSVNRYYLLGALSIGLMVPFLGGFIPANQTSIEIYYVMEKISEVEITPFTETEKPIFTWYNLLYTIYFLGAYVVFLRFAYGLSKIHSIYKHATKTKNKNYTLVESTKYHLPFSFFHYIFISKKLPLNNNVEKVLKHEELHANQWHSLDIVFAEILQVFFWFNPVLLFYKKALKQSHEYLADAYVTKDHNRSSYGQLLLRQSTSGLEIALANQFFHSQIKKRITMMYKEKSKRPAMVKYLAVVPILIAMLFIFSSSKMDKGNLNENLTEASEHLFGVKDQIPSTNETQGDPIFKVVEEMPRFPGCEQGDASPKDKEGCAKQKMLEFIYQNVTYPSKARNADIEGMTVVSFIIEKDGKIANAKVVRDIGGGCGEASLNVVNSMPIWTPGKQKGKAVRVQYTLPIKYKLEGEKKDEVQKDKFAKITGTGKKSEKATKENLVILQDQSLGASSTNDEIYKVVQEMPRFPGCEDDNISQDEKKECAKLKMLKYIYSNIKYPSEAKEKGIEGMVVVQMIIEKDGSVTSSIVLRDPGAGTGSEAKRVIDMMPKWIPGKQQGKKVRVQYTLPIKYKLEAEAKEERKQNLIIEKSKFVKIENLKTLMLTAGFGSGCDITKYRIVHTPPGDEAYLNNSNQDKFDSKTKDLISNANVGDRYIIEEIHCKCPGDKEAKDYGWLMIKISEDVDNVIENEVDQVPLFPGATTKEESGQSLINFVFKNVTYPKEAKQSEIEGLTIVKFVVTSNGEIQNIRLAKSLGWGIDEVVMEMMDKMKDIDTPWTPAIADDRNVTYEYVLPVKFKLQDDQKEEVKSNKLKIQVLNIKPNPSNGIFTLAFNIKDKTPADVMFYSSNGQKVKSLLNVNVPFSQSIDLSEYNGQTVYIRIAQNGKVHTEKVIIH